MPTPKRKRKKQGGEHRPSPKTVLTSAAVALPLALAVGALLMLPLGGLLLRVKNPTVGVRIAGPVLLYVISLIAGFAAVRHHRRVCSLAVGLSAGALLLLLLFILSLAVRGTATHTPAVNLLLHALVLPFTMGGALLGAREKRQKRRKRY